MKNDQLILEKVNEVTKKGTGKAFGTFGEMLQGILPDNLNFLVTLPIGRYSLCHFYPQPEQTDLHIKPAHKKKSLQLAKDILLSYGLPLGGQVEIRSELREGKGLASSTADMIATARAIEDSFKLKIPVNELESMIRKIEPSDGIMYQGVVSYFHREVKLKERIGCCPPLSILAIDEGGVIDTVTFNLEPKPFTDLNKNEYQTLLDELTLAIKTGNVRRLGDVTTRSAELNQLLHPKKTLEKMKTINKAIGGSGIVTAHSGTYIGIIISRDDPEYHAKIQKGLYELENNGYEVDIFHSLEIPQTEMEEYDEEINDRPNRRNSNHFPASR